MSVPHPEGRVQPRRNVLRSVQARAAVESVLVPVCGRNLAFPVRREIPAEVRRLWHERLRALRAAGWDKVRPHYRLGIVEKCPWGLLGLDDHARGKKARRCQLLACPACHAHKSALLAESIVRCLRKNPDANLRLLRRVRVVPLVDLPSAVRAAKQNPDPGADGYFREITVEAVSLNQVRVRVAHLLINPSRPKRGKKVRATYIGVVKLVARMRPYAASNLWCEWDQDGVCQAGLLNLLGGVWLSSRAGVARTKGGATRTLKGCAKLFLGAEDAPTTPGPELDSSGDDELLLDGDEGLPEEEADPDVERFDEDEYVLPEMYPHTNKLTRAEMLAEMELLEPVWAANAAAEDDWVEVGSPIRVGDVAAVEADEDGAGEYLDSRAESEFDRAADGENPDLVRRGVEDYYSTSTMKTSGRRRRKLFPRQGRAAGQLIPLSLSEILRRVPPRSNSPSCTPLTRSLRGAARRASRPLGAQIRRTGRTEAQSSTHRVCANTPITASTRASTPPPCRSSTPSATPGAGHVGHVARSTGPALGGRVAGTQTDTRCASTLAAGPSGAGAADAYGGVPVRGPGREYGLTPSLHTAARGR